jgi:endo-1,4-beta-xylanase
MLDKSSKNTKIHHAYFAVVAIIVLLILLAVVVRTSMQERNKVDWLNQSNWSQFTGAEVTNNGVRIFPTGRVINHTDTSMAQPNPPINTRGSHLKISGDFQIDFEISGVDNEATIQFYGQVPIIYDEWRQERPSIRFETMNDELKVRIWDGTAANSIDERVFYLDLANDASFGLVHKNDKFIILANGRSLGTIPDHNILSEGTIWFGADAKLETEGWTLTSLTARGQSKDSVELREAYSIVKTPEDPESLRSLSEKNSRKIPIGAAVSIIPLLTDKKYNEIVLSQFSMITPENSFKPQFIQPLQDVYTFNDTDILVEAAENNQMLVHGHALVMGKATPEWMQKTPEEERKQVMIDHITTVVNRYKGKISQWDVVNEPMSENAIDYKEGRLGLRKHMWLDAVGEEYIDIAHKAVRAADADAKIYLNDFGLERDGERWDAFLSLVKRLQSRGVPIDGVGFEAHVYHSPADDIDPAVLRSHIQTLATMGIESRISEIDVLGDDPIFQAKQYSEVLEVCLSEPTCTSYGVWGISDLYGSTTLSDRYPIVLGDSLLWSENYTPKLAFNNLRATLSNF